MKHESVIESRFKDSDCTVSDLKKTLFCLAVNLLPLEVLRTVFEDGDPDLPIKRGPGKWRSV